VPIRQAHGARTLASGGDDRGEFLGSRFVRVVALGQRRMRRAVMHGGPGGEVASQYRRSEEGEP